MQTDAVQQKGATKTPKLLAVLLGTALAAGCGGPAALLHDVLDEAEERVQFVLDSYEDTEDAMNEAAAMELPPCPAWYEPPPLSGDAPYEEMFERPTELPTGREETRLRRTHRTVCEEGETVLQNIPAAREELQRQLEDYAEYADALRDFIDDDMSDDDVERLSAEVEAVDAARTGDEDTLERRYSLMNDRLLALSPLVREMALEARRPGARVRPGQIPDPERHDTAEELRELLEPWTAVTAAHAEARAFLTTAADYRRRIYEGPNAPDPDETAGDWNPPTGTWEGEYAQVGGFSFGGIRTSRVRITIDADGGVASDYPDSNCGGALQLNSTSGAFDRVTEYRESLTTGERNCENGGTVTLERTWENRMRFSWRGRQSYAGNLTRE